MPNNLEIHSFFQNLRHLLKIYLLIPVVPMVNYLHLIDEKPVSVDNFSVKITNCPASLNYIITEELKEVLISQTSLDLIEFEGDLQFSGEITKYKIIPTAIKPNETAAQNRLIIEIRTIYQNKLNKQQNFESTFSRYRDFNSSENLLEIENDLIKEISKELIEDVFNKAFVNW